MDVYAKHRADKAAQMASCFSNVDEIRKGEISDRLANGYGSGSEPIKFKKTGKEIIEKLPSIESTLTNAKAVINAELAALKIKIGSDPTESYSSKKFNLLRYPYKMTETAYDPLNRCYLDPTESQTCCAKYNDLCWQLLDIEQDLEAIKVIGSNLESERSYDLSVGQLVALQFNS